MKTTVILAALFVYASISSNANPTVEELHERVVKLELELRILRSEVEKLREERRPKGSRPGLGAIIIDVSKSGDLVVDGKVISVEEVQEKLRIIARLHADQKIRIRAHSDTQFRNVLKAIEICQDAGLWKVTFSRRDETTE